MRSSFVRLVFLVAQRDYLRTVRRRGFIIATLLLPVGMAAIMFVSGVAANSGSEQTGQPIALVNESSVVLKPDPRLTPDITLVDRATAEAQLQSGAIKGYYVVPDWSCASALARSTRVMSGVRRGSGWRTTEIGRASCRERV